MFTIPGVLLEILGQGVLIKGESGVGKSTVALALVDRGHQLVADDAVCFEKSGETVTGSCPAEIQDFMYIKEFGIINIREMFGATAVSLNTELKLIIFLSSAAKTKFGCLSEPYETTSILDVDIPMLVMAATHCSLAMFIETIVRNLILKSQGYSAVKAFNEQHQKFIHTHQTKRS